MSPDMQFKIVNLAALPFWGLMIFAPGWSVTRRVMESFAAPAAFAVLYAALIAPALPDILPMMLSPPDLGKVLAAIAQPQAFVVAWVHYLAFDLFVGRWEYLDSRERGVSPWLTGPCLFLTLMLGPLGFLAYLAARGLSRQRPA
ncbi:MAG: ABA4-like family protein [Gemmataceae bacterium]